MPRWLLSAAYVLACLGCGALEQALPVLRLEVTPWSPQAGLTLAYLCWVGWRHVPVAVAALFLASAVPAGPTVDWAAHLGSALWTATIYAALVRAMGVHGIRGTLLSLGATLRMVLAAAAAALVVAAGHALLWNLLADPARELSFTGVARIWIGETNGLLMLAPLLLALPQLRPGLQVLRAGAGQALLQAGLVVVLVWLLFGYLDLSEDQRLFYPLFVPVIWIAMRWGAVGALLAGLGVQLGIMLSMRTMPAESPADLQFLVLTLTVTGLLLGVAVSERARARAEAQERDRQLARAMRFAVAGEMASALTHELNQPITALVSYLQASQIMSAPAAGVDERLMQTLQKAAREAHRAAEVLRRLRDFYQGTGPAPPGAVNVAACCASVLELLEPRLRDQQVHVQLALPPELPAVAADRTQVEMVLHNLVTNAVDACASGHAGSRALLVQSRLDAGQLRLAVHDSGAGVADDALGQLFEPFNTTKPDGMGLGLAICRGLLRAQGGDLVYRRSELLGGACFELRFALFR